LTVDHFLPRGAFLKNTTWITGIVAFTGTNTKMMLNSKCKTSAKIGVIDQRLGSYVMQIFAVQLMMAAAVTVMGLTVTDLSYL